MCQENKRHVHADLIIAWANGAEIEYRDKESSYWYPTLAPTWSTLCDYRIKPKPPVKKYIWAFSLRRDGFAKVTQAYYESEEDFVHNWFSNELGVPAFNWIQRIDTSVKEFPA